MLKAGAGWLLQGDSFILFIKTSRSSREKVCVQMGLSCLVLSNGFQMKTYRVQWTKPEKAKENVILKT